MNKYFHVKKIKLFNDQGTKRKYITLLLFLSEKFLNFFFIYVLQKFVHYKAGVLSLQLGRTTSSILLSLPCSR